MRNKIVCYNLQIIEFERNPKIRFYKHNAVNKKGKKMNKNYFLVLIVAMVFFVAGCASCKSKCTKKSGPCPMKMHDGAMKAEEMTAPKVEEAVAPAVEVATQGTEIVQNTMVVVEQNAEVK